MARAGDVLPSPRRYERGEFLDAVWTYRPGEHVTILGNTGSGKTYLAQQLLERTATPELPALVLVMKPVDRTVEKWRRTVDYRRVPSWPAPPSIWRPRKPTGWVLWPTHRYDPAIDDPAHYRIFRRAILDSYKRGNRILFADETAGLAELGLGDELITCWRRMRSTGAALWAASQTPTHMPRLAYTQASHLFLARMPDYDAQKRLAEIAAVDTAVVRRVVATLPRWDWLYIRQEDQTMCVIGR